MNVPFVDLQKEYAHLSKDIDAAIASVLQSGQFILGHQVKSFEREIATYCNSSYALGLANGSDALFIALLASGVGPGDEVITTPFTFFATASAITRTGAKPVFVDIDASSMNIDPCRIERVCTPKTKAIIVVHLFGQPAPMDAIMHVAEQNSLIVIEDAAQAFGSRYRGKHVGTIGHVGCFSFFPTKNLGCYGDGGLLLTNQSEVYDESRLLRVHGSQGNYIHECLGYNSRLDEIQAAILRTKLAHVETWNDRRRDIAKQYDFALGKYAQLSVSTSREECQNSYNQYPILLERRDELMAYLSSHGVSTMVYYPKPLHLQPVFRDLHYKSGDFPIAEQVARTILCLPIHPFMDSDSQEYVIFHVEEFLKRFH